MLSKSTAIVVTLMLVLSGCSGSVQHEQSTFEPGTLTISFDYTKQSGFGSNQFAVWIEDVDGNLIKTLYATKFTANGGYKNRPDSIPMWVAKSALASIEKPEVDAITGATPKAGTLAYVWNLTDTDGSDVLPGTYRFIVEGSTRGKNRTIHTGTIELADISVTVEADVELFLEDSQGYPALTEESVENNMIISVKAYYLPAA